MGLVFQGILLGHYFYQANIAKVTTESSDIRFYSLIVTAEEYFFKVLADLTLFVTLSRGIIEGSLVFAMQVQQGIDRECVC